VVAFQYMGTTEPIYNSTMREVIAEERSQQPAEEHWACPSIPRPESLTPTMDPHTAPVILAHHSYYDFRKSRTVQIKAS
jgi:hypothetical protein